jgi:hypothetical protein
LMAAFLPQEADLVKELFCEDITVRNSLM